MNDSISRNSKLYVNGELIGNVYDFNMSIEQDVFSADFTIKTPKKRTVIIRFETDDISKEFKNNVIKQQRVKNWKKLMSGE